MVESRATVFHIENIKNAETTAKLEFFTSLAKKFCLNAFDANAENRFKIDLSLNRDMTVMLLASKVRNKELQKPTFFLRKNIVVVLAVLYCCVCPKAADEDTKSSGSRTPATLPKTVSLEDIDERKNVMLSWLAVSDSTSPVLSVSASGRQQGIGKFMCKFIIKQCDAFANGGNIEIFLQCHEPGALRLLLSAAGFQRLNSNHDDGFTLLPKSLQDVLLRFHQRRRRDAISNLPFHFWVMILNKLGNLLPSQCTWATNSYDP